MQHGIEARDGEVFKLIFESANSDWQQSVTLVTDKVVRLGNKNFKRGVIVHYDPSHPESLFEVRTMGGMLWVWNSWHYRDAQGSLHTSSQLNYSGMIVEKISTGFRYRCNEGRDDDDFDDLIFRIERTGMVDSAVARDTKGRLSDDSCSVFEKSSRCPKRLIDSV